MENFGESVLVNNAERQRFELQVEGYDAFIDYKEMSDTISLTHTEVAPELRGKGIAPLLVKKSLKSIEEENKTILPFCPYIFKYIQKHPEWKFLVSKGFKDYDKL